MKSFIKRITSLAVSALVVAGISAVSLGGTANAIPWSSTATGLDHPGFNVFTGVPGFGDESDFVRGRVTGSSNSFADPVNDSCADGTQYSVQVYVHNAANQTLNNNGTGPGVAHNTKVKVTLPSTTANKISGTVSADQVTSVTDTLSINCNGKTMQLSYVTGSAIQQHIDGSTNPLNDSIVTSGAKIGTHAADGDVWGCFDQRVIVYLKVKVTEIPPTPSTGVCKEAVFEIDYRNRRVSVNKVTPAVSNATVVGHRIDWGDHSTPSDKETDSHTYATDGTYHVVVSVQVRFADGHTEWVTSADNGCKQTAIFSTTVTKENCKTKGKENLAADDKNCPEEQVTVLVNTGPGAMLGIFAGVTAAGALAHRFWLQRKFNR